MEIHNVFQKAISTDNVAVVKFLLKNYLNEIDDSYINKSLEDISRQCSILITPRKSSMDIFQYILDNCSDKITDATIKYSRDFAIKYGFIDLVKILTEHNEKKEKVTITMSREDYNKVKDIINNLKIK